MAHPNAKTASCLYKTVISDDTHHTLPITAIQNTSPQFLTFMEILSRLMKKYPGLVMRVDPNGFPNIHVPIEHADSLQVIEQTILDRLLS